MEPDSFANTSTDSFEEYVEDLRKTINDIVLSLPVESGEAMYQKVVDIASIVRETGIDILTNSEKKQLINIAKILTRRYSVEKKSLDFSAEQTSIVVKELAFLYNLPA